MHHRPAADWRLTRRTREQCFGRNGSFGNRLRASRKRRNRGADRYEQERERNTTTHGNLRVAQMDGREKVPRRGGFDKQRAAALNLYGLEASPPMACKFSVARALPGSSCSARLKWAIAFCVSPSSASAAPRFASAAASPGRSFAAVANSSAAFEN